MKIAVITGRGLETYGGIETYVRHVYGHLAQGGHRITVYCRGNGRYAYPSGNIIERIRLPYIKLHYLDVFSHCIISVFHAWLRKYDIICYHGAPAALAACLPVKLGTKKVVVFHGLDWINPALNRFSRLGVLISEVCSWRFSSRLVVISQWLKEYFKDKYQAQADYVPPGATPHNSPLSPRQIRQFGLKEKNYILYLGRLTPEKGCHLLVNAYRSLETRMKLVIAGKPIFGLQDKYYRRLKQLARDDQRIIFTGLVEGVMREELLSNAYLVIYPAFVGGLPLTILEAMAYKRCTLVSSICDYYEVIKDHSILFKTGDAGDLAGKLRLLIEDSGMCSRHGRTAQEYVSRRFSWHDTALEFERIFQEVRNNGRRGSPNRQGN